MLRTIVFILFLAQAQAATCSRPVRVSATPVGSSLIMTDKQLTGAYPDLLARVTQLTGCRFEYLPMPINRAHMMMKSGEIDLIPITVQTPERDAEGEFIASSRNRLMLIYLKDKKTAIQTLSQLRDSQLQINVVRGQSFGKTYNEWLANPKTREHLEEVTTTDQIAQKLLIGRADAVVIPLGGFAGSVERFAMEDKIAFHPITDIAPLMLGTYLNTKSLLNSDRELLKKTLRQLLQKGEYDQLLRRHYPAWSLPSILPVH